MNRHTWKVALLLFGSGTCALIYQTAWLRMFRMIFGASTLATAAVLAIFMAGLGIGSALLGKRADASPRPLGYYARLEFLIAGAAALSLLLLEVVEFVYIGLGGSVSLGPFFATIVRLLLALLVLGIPTFLMGGTLPAAARAVESLEDTSRRRLALLYGLNTLGAVTGALLSTFLLLEHLGNRMTLIVAVLANVVVAIVANSLSRTHETGSGSEQAPAPVVAPAETQAAALPPHLVYGASAAVGFSFLLMELVWYRMLSPLLGGTTFMFGLILAVALLGIGLGGAAYSLFGGRGTPGAFALTCSLEAAAMILPFALGDRLAVLTSLLRSLGTIGFAGDVIIWTVVTTVVVFPAAFISGIQFPILIALLGRGRDDVGRQVGATYAWNTAGAIAGSLAGGFGLMPLLSAPGCWRLVAALLTIVAVIALAYAVRARQVFSVVAAAIAAAIALGGTFATGPTAVWRHSGIGAKRAPLPSSLQDLREWMNTSRRTVTWDADGRESSVALVASEDYAMLVNGKSDGSARGDAGTQVMSAMIGAIVHGKVESSMVIGLGTGSTAGWLGAIPQMKNVDVVELEPLSIDIARACSPVNENVLANPKVKVTIGDAREVLLTTRSRYDLIFSEPSNPYRAGIASLFTKEYYEASAAILRPNGVFLQWVQTYGIDAETVQTIYATMTEVFPHVDTWWTSPGDLVLLASREPVTYDIDAIRRRLAAEPYRSAAHNAWRIESAEGFLSHFVAPSSVATAIAASAPSLNTDDKTTIEFGFARAMGSMNFRMAHLYELAAARKAQRPERIKGAVDWQLVGANLATVPYAPAGGPRATFARQAEDSNYAAALEVWRAAPWQPVNSSEAAMLAMAFADSADPAALGLAQQLRQWQPLEADAILARYYVRTKDLDRAAQHLQSALGGYRADAWPLRNVMREAIRTATILADADRGRAAFAADLLSKPFAAAQWEETRRAAQLNAARKADACGPRTIAALRQMEPHALWRGSVLRARVECYGKAGLPELSERAQEDWQTFVETQPAPLVH